MLTLLMPNNAIAGDADEAIMFSIEERARAEVLSDRAFDGMDGNAFVVGNRARVGMRIKDESVSAYVQVQDVRTWGSEEGSVGDGTAAALDFHQAYGQYKAQGNNLRIGRQEVGWNGERLLGAQNWMHTGASFDAVRLQHSKKFDAEVLYAFLNDAPNVDRADADICDDTHMFGLRAGPKTTKTLTVNGVVISRMDAYAEEKLHTVGVYADGNAGSIFYTVEGYGQMGSQGDSSVSAYLVGTRVGMKMKPGKVGLGLDMVSGDDDLTDDTVKSFDTLYGSNHRFYGHMDMYMNVAGDTAGEGLMDVMLFTKLKATDALNVSLDAHLLQSAAGGTKHGMEFDLEGRYSVSDALNISGGLWAFMPDEFYDASGDASSEIGLFTQAVFSL